MQSRGADASPWDVSIGLAVICSLLSNFMSNTATTAVMSPFVIEWAKMIGDRSLTYVIIDIIASNICFVTPISTPPITMTLPEGYRFKDYSIVGGVFNILSLVASAVCIPLIYGF